MNFDNILKDKNILIGTSGWSYKHWKNIFYPAGTNQSNWFEFFASKFSTVEINNTFYKMPEKQTIIKWRDASPENFKFSVKANRIITHIKKLNSVDEDLKIFMDAVSKFKEKLAMMLFQFPPSFIFNAMLLENFIDKLPKDFNYTFEFRNTSWWDFSIFELLSKNNIAFCNYEKSVEITPRISTSKNIYIRFHNPQNPAENHFDENTLNDWKEFILRENSEGKNIYCYFNNDLGGYAIEDAYILELLLAESLKIS